MSENLKFDNKTNTLTVADVEGVDYVIRGEVVTGEVKLSKTTTVRARPAKGFSFPKGVETSWTFEVDGDSAPSEPKKDAPQGGDQPQRQRGFVNDPKDTRAEGHVVGPQSNQ